MNPESLPIDNIGTAQPQPDDGLDFFQGIDKAFESLTPSSPETPVAEEPATKPVEEKPAATTTTKTGDDLIAEAEENLAKGKSPRAPQWEALKAAKEAAAKEAAEMRKELEALRSSKPSDDQEKQTLKQQLEELKKQQEGYEAEIKAVRVESSREFQEVINKPALAIRDAAEALALRNGIDKDAVISAIVEQNPSKRNAALSELISQLNEVEKLDLLSMSKDFADLSVRRQRLLENSNVAHAELESKRAAEALAEKEKLNATWKADSDRAWNAITSKIPNVKDLPGADAILAEVASRTPDSVPVLEQTYSLMAGRLLPAYVKETFTLKNKVAELETALAKYRSSTPGAGSGGSAPASDASSLGAELSFEEAISAGLSRV